MSINNKIYKCLSSLVSRKARAYPISNSYDSILSSNPKYLCHFLKNWKLLNKFSSTTIRNAYTNSSIYCNETRDQETNRLVKFRESPFNSYANKYKLKNSLLYKKTAISRLNLGAAIGETQLALPAQHFSTSHLCKAKENESENKKEALLPKFKRMWKDYWYVVIPVHLVTSIGWYGGFYLLIKSGVDVAALLEWIGTSEAYLEKIRNSNLGTFALMFACYKIATPVRYTVTVGGSSWTIGYLSKRGIMKTDQIKDELQERSDQIKRRTRQAYKEVVRYRRTMQAHRDEVDKEWTKFAKRKPKSKE